MSNGDLPMQIGHVQIRQGMCITVESENYLGGDRSSNFRVTLDGISDGISVDEINLLITSAFGAMPIRNSRE